MINRKNTTYLIPALVLLFSVLNAIYLYWPALTYPFIIEDDVRQRFPWLATLHGMDQFNHYYAADYYRYWMNLGYRLIYHLLSVLFDPIISGQFLGIFLYGITGVLFYFLGMRLDGKKLGIIMVVMFLYNPAHIQEFLGGHARGFALPLVLAFLLAVQSGNHVLISGSLACQFLFYPVVFPVCFFPAAGYMFFQWRAKPSYQKLVRALVVLLSPFLIYLINEYVRSFYYLDYFGKLLTGDEIYGSMEFYKNGGPRWYVPVASDAKDLEFYLSYYAPHLILIVVLILLLPFTTRNRVSSMRQKLKWVLVLLPSAVLAYILADLCFMRLYFPERHLRYAIPILLVVSGGEGIKMILEKINSKKIKTVLILFFAMVWGLDIAVARYQGIFIYVNATHQANLYKFLRSLPADSHIAAPPWVADNIPTFSQKRVFISIEQCYFFHKGIRKMAFQRWEDYYRAIYEDDGKKIYQFCRKNSIDYLVVEHYSYRKPMIKQNEILYGEDRKRIFKKAIRNHGRYFLQNIEDEKKIFETEHGRYFVIKTDQETLMS